MKVSCLNGNIIFPLQVVSSLVNFYHWDSSADLITTRVLAVDLRRESGEVLKVQNLTSDIQLEFQLREQAPGTDSNPAKIASFLKPEHMQYHIIEVTEVQASYLVTITTKDSLNVFLKFGSKPSVEDHDRNYTIPDFSSCTTSNGTDEEDEYNCTRHPHQLFLARDVLKRTGVYYLGILYSRNISADNYPLRKRRSCFRTTRAKRSCVDTRTPPPPLGVYQKSTIAPYDPRVDVNYAIETDELSCRFWSHDEEKWITEGCKVHMLFSSQESNEHDREKLLIFQKIQCGSEPPNWNLFKPYNKLHLIMLNTTGVTQLVLI